MLGWPGDLESLGCTDQPLALKVLALPLHPLVLLALVVGWGAFTLSGKRGAARVARSLLATLAAALGGLSLGFALVGWLLGLAINPSPFLSLAPWAWALVGPLATWLGSRRARGAVFASRDGQSQPPLGFAFALVATLSASVVFMVIAARYAIPDAARELSLPYRFFEWAVVDHLGPPSDECLATRVLEYAGDEQVGRDALKALARRGPSAARGVRARLSDLRSHWPPPDYTVKASGIRQLLQQLNVYGAHETVRQWADLDWRHDSPGPKLETELRLPR